MNSVSLSTEIIKRICTTSTITLYLFPILKYIRIPLKYLNIKIPIIWIYIHCRNE